MKKEFVCLVFLFLFASMLPQVALSQPITADSLTNELKISRSDTQRVRILLELAWVHRAEDDARKAAGYAQQALQLATKAGNVSQQAASYYELGADYWTSSELAKARYSLNQSIRLAQKLGDEDQLIKSYNILGSTYYGESVFDQALLYFRKGLQLAKKINDKQKISGSLINVGNVFLSKGEYVSAATEYVEALRLAEEVQYIDGMNVITANLGTIYYYQGDLAKAETYYLRSLEIDRKTNDNDGMASNLENLGIICIDQKKYAKALNHFQESLAISERIGNTQGTTNSLAGIGKIYEQTGKWQQALETDLKALALAEQLHTQELVATVNINLADVYNRLKTYSSALQHGKKGLQVAHQIGHKETTRAAYQSLANTYEALGDHKQALHHYKKYVQLKDSLTNEANLRKVDEIQGQYASEKTAQQIKVLSQQAQIQQLQISQQRSYLAIAVAVVLLLVLFGWLFIKQQRLKTHQTIVDLEHKLLGNQLNPHFIFNALTAIQNFMFKNSPAEAGKYLAKFAKLMRLILENSRQPYIALTKEIQTLEYYFELQQLRFPQSFEYQIYVDPRLNPDQVSVPPMFVQPLIENALEHGLLHKVDRGIVKVRYLLEGDKILLEVEDNGVGREEAAQIKRKTKSEYTSLATKITQERLAILNRSKKCKITFDVVDLMNVDQIVQGTKATFFIPFKTLI